MTAIGPGDFVEFVNPNHPQGGVVRRLVAGALYIVESMGEVPHDPGHDFGGQWWVRLVGVKNSPDTVGFWLGHFKPIYRPKPDAFTRLLDAPIREPELTPA